MHDERNQLQSTRYYFQGVISKLLEIIHGVEIIQLVLVCLSTDDMLMSQVCCALLDMYCTYVDTWQCTVVLVVLYKQIENPHPTSISFLEASWHIESMWCFGKSIDASSEDLDLLAKLEQFSSDPAV